MCEHQHEQPYDHVVHLKFSNRHNFSNYDTRGILAVSFLMRFLYATILLATAASAQYSRGTWTAFGGDPQRTGWNKAETEITPETAPKLKLEWSIKLDNTPLAMHGLTPPIARAQIYTAKGVRDLVIVAGSSDKLYVIDSDTGKLYWQKMLATEGVPQRTSTWLCPNALTATPVLGPAPSGTTGNGQALYVLASDGRLHAFNLISGEDLTPPTKFVPSFAKRLTRLFPGAAGTGWPSHFSNGLPPTVSRIVGTRSTRCPGAFRNSPRAAMPFGQETISGVEMPPS